VGEPCIDLRDIIKCGYLNEMVQYIELYFVLLTTHCWTHKR